LKALENMKVRLLPVVAFCIWLGLCACTRHHLATEVDQRSNASSLDIWLDDTLIPYLAQQFARHPRFKERPVLLVRMQGNNVQPRIDDLTNQIRQKIMDGLLKQPGLDLSWRPAIQSYKHHLTLEDFTCGDFRKTHYFVGIDCGLTQVERQLYVKVRALNVVEKKWISGFGKSWQGASTELQREALNREQPDDYLRGLRPLPFSDRQPDLLAAYLARNLSCLMRQGEEDEPVVYVENVALHTHDFFHTTMELVGNYLAQFREVEVTNDPGRANVTLVSEIHTIHQNLHQVWVAARYDKEATYLPGAETEAYVLIDSPTQTAVADKLPYNPDRSNHPSDQARAPLLISSFGLLTPMETAVCATDTPWISGLRRVESWTHLPSGGCLAIEISLSAAAYVFLVGQDANGQQTALFPSDCPAFRNITALRRPGNLFRFPPLSTPDQGILTLDGSPGMERVYAIAITEKDLADRFAYRLAEHRGLCRPAKSAENIGSVGSPVSSDERIQHWQKYLNHLSDQFPGMVEWREILFWHDLPG
jgi:hypothetical protein